VKLIQGQMLEHVAGINTATVLVGDGETLDDVANSNVGGYRCAFFVQIRPTMGVLSHLSVSDESKFSQPSGAAERSASVLHVHVSILVEMKW
jgi:hypothetical protein